MSKKAADIYKDIIRKKGLEAAEESVVRNLRYKMTFLLEQVALRQVTEYKQGKNILIPDNDAPIVRNLLMCSIDDEYPFIVDWFNQSLDLSDSDNSIWLFLSIKEPIMRAGMMGETDFVTVDEWISSIQCLINYDMAENTRRMKIKLENFRTKTLVMNNTVNYGDMYVTYDNGDREYVSMGKREKAKLSKDLLETIVGSLRLQTDYFDVLEQIIDYMIEDAEEKSLPYIEFYAKLKKLSECESAKDMIKNANRSMVSEYYPWFKKIAEFLKKNPKRIEDIENKTKTTDLVQFFSN